MKGTHSVFLPPGVRLRGILFAKEVTGGLKTGWEAVCGGYDNLPPKSGEIFEHIGETNWGATFSRFPHAVQ